MVTLRELATKYCQCYWRWVFLRLFKLFT